MTLSVNLLRPWRHPGRLWRLACYNVTALPVAVAAFAFAATALSLVGGLLVTVVLAVPVAWVLFVGARGLGWFERSRIAGLVGTTIPDPVPPLVAASWWGRLRERVTSAPRWREIGHHVAHLPLAALSYTLTLVAWSGSLALLALPAYVDALPDGVARFHFFDVNAGREAFTAAGIGLAGLVLVAPWVTIGVARVALMVARGLLGPTAGAAHQAEVRKLETQRGAAVDSAEAERRRIERDLHDGAQQRLVALAAGLGAAREKLEADPEGGRQMVASAHEEAKAALQELRDLVRGIHPVILEDRGLDAALSAVVARSPVPVALDVRLTGRLPAAVESAAYFVVSEALANVAKHAGAQRAGVAIAQAGGRLVVEVRDDGRGGADPARGSGLRGLHDRVTALGGSLHVTSPAGGPTSVAVELPCGS